LSSHWLSKNAKIKAHETIILPVVLYGCETWSLTLREEHKLKVPESRVLSRIFGLKRDDHLCGLVVRVPAYISRGPGFDSRLYQIF
jgi:hypothetical protein